MEQTPLSSPHKVSMERTPLCCTTNMTGGNYQNFQFEADGTKISSINDSLDTLFRERMEDDCAELESIVQLLHGLRIYDKLDDNLVSLVIKSLQTGVGIMSPYIEGGIYAGVSPELTSLAKCLVLGYRMKLGQCHYLLLGLSNLGYLSIDLGPAHIAMVHQASSEHAPTVSKGRRRSVLRGRTSSFFKKVLQKEAKHREPSRS